MRVEPADERPTPCRRGLLSRDARACDPEPRDPGLVERVEDDRRIVLLHDRERRQVLAADILRDRVCSARSAARSPKRPLRVPEEPLELVRGRRHARVVEADEEVLLVALGERSEVIDEVARRGAETTARGLCAQLRQVGIEAVLGFGCALGAIVSLGIDRDLVRDAAEDRRVTRYSSRESDLVPVGSERFREALEEGPIATTVFLFRPFFRSSATSSCNVSSRS